MSHAGAVPSADALRQPLLQELPSPRGSGKLDPLCGKLHSPPSPTGGRRSVAELQQALDEYCHEYSSGGPGGGDGHPRQGERALRAHASDPMEYLPGSPGGPGGEWQACPKRASTPGRFRRRYIPPGDSPGSNEVLDFILDVAFDVQEHYDRLAQRDINSPVALVGAGAQKARRQSSDVATVLVILKSFVGGTLLVVPAEFMKAGVVSGCALFWAVGLLELWCMLKLLEAHQVRGGSFSDMAGQAMGRAGAAAVDASIVFSQVGFTAAEMAYVAQNGSTALHRLIRHFPQLAGLFGGGLPEPDDLAAALTWMQLLFAVPVAWYRELAALTAFNFLGNLLVFGTLVALTALTFGGLAQRGVAEDFELGCPVQQAMVFLGFSVFTFEGINMVIPMYHAHRDKKSFNRILVWTIIVIITIFTSFACSNVLLYGSELQPILTLNLPPDSHFVGWVPLAFAVASMFLVPLMAFPTFEILEGFVGKGRCRALVGSHGRVNAFRALLMVLCALVARYGGPHLGTFLALIGAVGCVPLAFVYPAAIHLRLIARSTAGVLGDLFCLVFGIGITLFCTAGVFWPSDSA